MGNSGSGKSTLAKQLSAEHDLVHLDLDTLAWLPTSPPRRDPDGAAKLDAVLGNERWVIEGCYADLLARAASRCTELVFLDPGADVCIEHARARPWEPHKYTSKEAQDANLPMLIDWIRAYETRTDEFSRQAHRALFESFPGAKREVR